MYLIKVICYDLFPYCLGEIEEASNYHNCRESYPCCFPELEKIMIFLKKSKKSKSH